MMRVTEILTLCGLREWPASVRHEDREWCLQRGTMIHRACAVLNGGRTIDPASLDERIAGYVEAYQKFRREVGGLVLGYEKEVRCAALGYVGHYDVVIAKPATCTRRAVLYDIKTNEADVVTRLQTAGYVYALRGKGLRRGFVALHVDGTYKTEVYKDDTRDVATWLACCQLAAWLKKNGKGG
ncbi:MAG: hypothetical protein ABIF82_05865 [Planctomycetota bacterium]